MKNNKLLFFLFLLLPLTLWAQDDLLKSLEEEKDDTPEYVYGTFKSTRVINSQSVELLSAKHLDFRISHRFGKLNSGAYNFFGLDQATIRLALEYGLTDHVNIGFGRSSFGKTFDGFIKIKLLKQRSDRTWKMPVSVVWFSDMTLQSIKTSDEYINAHSTGRLAYTHQLIIGRKFSERLSFQVAPALVHFNYIQDSTQKNDIIALAMGGRCKISKRISFNVDYIYCINRPQNTYQNSLAIGIDIETGGHVFQLHVTNSQGMVEPAFIASTTGRIQKGDLFYGFNISRQFNLGKSRKKV
jgi:heme-degrading monooxygenase HmoA